jgi:hypothetical protein
MVGDAKPMSAGKNGREWRAPVRYESAASAGCGTADLFARSLISSCVRGGEREEHVTCDYQLLAFHDGEREQRALQTLQP